MSITPPLCPKCGSIMHEGYIADLAGLNTVYDQVWIRGKCEPGVRTRWTKRGKEKHHVRTFRCGECGFLESYA